MNAKKLAILVAVLCVPAVAGAQAISASATIELVDPFPGGWFPSENLDLYARVVNNGGQTIKVGADLVFEVEKNKDAVAHSHSGVVHLHTHGDTSYSSPYDDPFRQVPGHKDDIGVMVPPGHAYAISSTDYDPRFIYSSPQRPVRAHYRIEEGRWRCYPADSGTTADFLFGMCPSVAVPESVGLSRFPTFVLYVFYVANRPLLWHGIGG